MVMETDKRYAVEVVGSFIARFTFTCRGVEATFTRDPALAARVSSQAIAEQIATAVGGRVREVKP